MLAYLEGGKCNRKTQFLTRTAWLTIKGISGISGWTIRVFRVGLYGYFGLDYKGKMVGGISGNFVGLYGCFVLDYKGKMVGVSPPLRGYGGG